MSRINHGLCVLVLMALVAGLLGWKSSRMAILFADGLRYIHQAQLLDQGSLIEGLLQSVDHPAYPAAIAAAHRVIGGQEPEDWQSAAQFVSVLSGILLVVPLYLIAVELFGARVAWLSVCLTYLVPITSNIFSDVLSEAIFLLFWSWSLWTALRYLRHGHLVWIPPTILLAGAAYLARPEGLLLPAALIATVLVMPFLRSGHLNWPRWWAAVGVLIIGPILIVGPYMVYKGGLGTKPAIARILGMSPPSPADAVERNRPLDLEESVSRTYIVAAKATFKAVRDAVTFPLLALAALGILTAKLHQTRPRQAVLMGIVLLASALALIRLHATGGYCSPRHALIPALILLGAAGLGLNHLLASVAIPGKYLGQGETTVRLGPVFWLVALGLIGALNAPNLQAPLNKPFSAYRLAAEWLRPQMQPGDRVVDLTGWSQFYSQAEGYTFGTVIYAAADQKARWVVVREAHIHGPWNYCQQIRNLIGLKKPIATFPDNPEERDARVFVYDRRLEGEPLLVGTPENRVLR